MAGPEDKEDTGMSVGAEKEEQLSPEGRLSKPRSGVGNRLPISFKCSFWHASQTASDN